MLRVLLRNVRPATRPTSQPLRNFSQAADKSGGAASDAQSAAKTPGNASTPKSGSNLSNFDKRVLVWTGKYKTIAEIPSVVRLDDLTRARDKFRVKVCNYMVVATVISCFVMIYSGKRAAKRGESVVKMNEEFHRQYNEAEAKKELLAKEGK